MPRRAFARPGLLLALLSAVATTTLLLSADPVQAPGSAGPLQPPPPRNVRMLTSDEDCSRPYPGILILERNLRGVDLRRAWVENEHCRVIMIDNQLPAAGWFLGVTFQDVDLREADLRGCRLDRARFFRCDLRAARLEGAIIQGVRYDRYTRWPESFRPEAHGARLVD